MRKIGHIFLVSLFLILALSGYSLANCDISGKVVDFKGKAVSGSVVVLFDAETGLPLKGKNYDEFSQKNMQEPFTFQLSDLKGKFEFKGVPAGDYKLIAQSWLNCEDFEKPAGKNSSEVRLDGVSEIISLDENKVSNVTVKPLGGSKVELDADLPNSDVFLVISTEPTKADPILGFVGWAGQFQENMIAGNRMIYGKSVISQLPSKKLYYSIFASDSIPGFTSGEIDLRKNDSVKINEIQFVNSWSNSRNTPPESLSVVFEEVSELLKIKDENLSKSIRKFYQENQIPIERSILGVELAPFLDKLLMLPSGIEATFGEVMAAVRYYELQKLVSKRREDLKRKQQDKKKTSRWYFVPDPKLPNVLIIGDSISVNYTIPLRRQLKGIANVYRPMKSSELHWNCGPTTSGIRNIDTWLGDKKWDIIQFNFGLHDIRYLDEKGKTSSFKTGKKQVPLEQYKQNLDILVKKMKETGAVLIFATTTPVPDGLETHLNKDVIKYNDAAIKIMRDNKALINDLYNFALPRLQELQLSKNVHFNNKGNIALAEKTAEFIKGVLKQK